MLDALEERDRLDEQFETTGRNPQGILKERPLSTSPDAHPVNGNYSLPGEDEEEEDDDNEKEDDLILGNEDEFKGDEEEYDVELDDDLDDIDEDDLVIDADDDVDDDDDLWKQFNKGSG